MHHRAIYLLHSMEQGRPRPRPMLDNCGGFQLKSEYIDGLEILYSLSITEPGEVAALG